ncbi:MAG: tyrosine-type recombinase/integrase [Proteobacteria bacterium]|nr:tyrosine-type recombinase/integrase [Pseudomonadota bacterium]
MGRTATKNKNLPVRMRARHRGEKIWYYYDAGGKPRKEIPLGCDYIAAVKKWADLEQSSEQHFVVVTFKDAADRYIREVLPTKAAATQKDNLRELVKLLAFFNDPPAPLDGIQPINIRQYMDWRVREAVKKNIENGRPNAGNGQVRANREKALFSHIWNSARNWGYTNRPNPCQGISGYKEEGRDVYVDGPEYMAVYNKADDALQEALDLAWLTGQRLADVLKFSETDIKNGELWLTQNKTGTKLRISIIGELELLLKRIVDRKHQHNVRSLKLLVDLDGLPLTASKLRWKFDKAREASGQKWQFRDLRAKAGTEKEMSGGMGKAKDLLGHTTEVMTSNYVRHRVGKLVNPTR